MCFSFPVVNGIYQNTVYGLAAKLPFKYTGAVVLGSVRENISEQIFKKNLPHKLNSLLESKWHNSGHHQHHLHRRCSQPQDRGHLLLHHGALHTARLLRHVFCVAFKCKLRKVA